MATSMRWNVPNHNMPFLEDDLRLERISVSGWFPMMLQTALDAAEAVERWR